MRRWHLIRCLGCLMCLGCLGVGAGHRVLGAAQPQRGITAAPAIARAYDLILDADFDRLKGDLPVICGPPSPTGFGATSPAPRVACLGLDALNLWWQIQLDPDSRALDPAFLAKTNAAIAEAERLTTAEPDRAEAWFYLGAAYGVRAQWRVYRVERLAAARDGKRIKESLERALALDPAMHDAEFGVGMYRYYADVAPAVLRFLRWLLLLPGGNRVEGLQQLERAATQGLLVRGEAQYQIHILYLWYENKSREALEIVRSLQGRYPHNPLFHQIEAEILDTYFHDAAASLRASERLLSLARTRAVHQPALAETVARLNMARQLRALTRPAAAIEQLDAIITSQPAAPAGALARAQRMRREIR
jgi:tetratricopeptide (TPR) repeat protein